jgi:hypothetical protein
VHESGVCLGQFYEYGSFLSNAFFHGEQYDQMDSSNLTSTAASLANVTMELNCKDLGKMYCWMDSLNLGSSD